jgi:hypothetical protein
MGQAVAVVIWFAVIGGLVVYAVVDNLREDDRIGTARTRLLGILGTVRRGRAAVTDRRIALTRTVHLEQARRLTRDPFELSPADLEGPDRLDGSRLRKMARSQVAELGAALSPASDDPDNPGRDRALACYDAAALLAAERNDRLDLLGAIVLAREGRTALTDRDPQPLPVCQVHPLHGPALRRPERRRRSRPPRKLPALCAGCKRCSGRERDQRALLAGDVPYYRTSCFWARVGFGALDAELPARVLEYLGVG